MPSPTLSVVTPTYNRASSLEAAVVAVCTQSRPPDEYVILDDGSTDETPALLERLAARFPMIRVLRNPRPSGVGPAVRQIVAAATGTFIYGAASDDQVLPGSLEALMRVAEAYPRSGIVFGHLLVQTLEGGHEEVGPRGWSVPRYADPEAFLRDYLRVETPSFSLCGATAYNREALAAIGGMPSELGHFCDTYAARTLGLAHGVGYVPTPIMLWQVDRNSASQRAARDPRRLLDVIARAAHLMRTRHAAYYPREFTADWARRAREEVVVEASEAFGASLERLLAGRQRRLPWGDRELARALRDRAVAGAAAGWRAYPGDLSCY